MFAGFYSEMKFCGWQARVRQLLHEQVCFKGEFIARLKAKYWSVVWNLVPSPFPSDFLPKPDESLSTGSDETPGSDDSAISRSSENSGKSKPTNKKRSKSSTPKTPSANKEHSTKSSPANSKDSSKTSKEKEPTNEIASSKVGLVQDILPLTPLSSKTETETTQKQQRKRKSTDSPVQPLVKKLTKEAPESRPSTPLIDIASDTSDSSPTAQLVRHSARKRTRRSKSLTKSQSPSPTNTKVPGPDNKIVAFEKQKEVAAEISLASNSTSSGSLANQKRRTSDRKRSLPTSRNESPNPSATQLEPSSAERPSRNKKLLPNGRHSNRNTPECSPAPQQKPLVDNKTDKKSATNRMTAKKSTTSTVITNKEEASILPKETLEAKMHKLESAVCTKCTVDLYNNIETDILFGEVRRGNRQTSNGEESTNESEVSTDLSTNQSPDLSANQSTDLSAKQNSDLSSNQNSDLSASRSSNISSNRHNQSPDFSANRRSDLSVNQSTDRSVNQNSESNRKAAPPERALRKKVLKSNASSQTNFDLPVRASSEKETVSLDNKKGNKKTPVTNEKPASKIETPQSTVPVRKSQRKRMPLDEPDIQTSEKKTALVTHESKPDTTKTANISAVKPSKQTGMGAFSKGKKNRTATGQFAKKSNILHDNLKKKLAKYKSVGRPKSENNVQKSSAQEISSKKSSNKMTASTDTVLANRNLRHKSRSVSPAKQMRASSASRQSSRLLQKSQVSANETSTDTSSPEQPSPSPSKYTYYYELQNDAVISKRKKETKIPELPNAGPVSDKNKKPSVATEKKGPESLDQNESGQNISVSNFYKGRKTRRSAPEVSNSDTPPKDGKPSTTKLTASQKMMEFSKWARESLDVKKVGKPESPQVEKSPKPKEEEKDKSPGEAPTSTKTRKPQNLRPTSKENPQESKKSPTDAKTPKPTDSTKRRSQPNKPTEVKSAQKTSTKNAPQAPGSPDVIELLDSTDTDALSTTSSETTSSSGSPCKCATCTNTSLSY